VYDAITQRTAFHAFAPFERPRDTHELAFHRIGRNAQRRVAMAAPIEEQEMRGQRGIRNTSRTVEIAAGLILEARAHTVAQQHVHRGARPLLAGHIREIECAQGVILGRLCSSASTRPGADTEPVMNAAPTGSNACGGSEPRCKSRPEAVAITRKPVTNPVIPESRTTSYIAARSTYALL
jgi:hypothetical protein